MNRIPCKQENHCLIPSNYLLIFSSFSKYLMKYRILI